MHIIMYQQYVVMSALKHMLITCYCINNQYDQYHVWMVQHGELKTITVHVNPDVYRDNPW